MNELQLFNNEELGLNVRGYVDEERNLYINADDIIRGIKGKYVQYKNGKEYVRYEKVNKDLVRQGFSPLRGKAENAENDFISESAVYLLIMNGENELAVAFQQWIARDVLPTLRKTGSYSVEDNIKNEYLENECDEVKYSFGSLEYFFSNIPSKDLETEYKLCKVYYSSYNHRIIGKSVHETKEVVGRKIIDILEHRIDNTDNAQEKNRCYECISKILKDKNLASSISNGKRIAKVSEENKRLNSRIEELLENNPELDLEGDFMWANLHGMSCNYMYSKDGHKRTTAYNHWCDDFNAIWKQYSEYYDRTNWEKRGVDFNKKIVLSVGFVYKSGFDLDNFLKSFIDFVITREYGIDDRNITAINVKTLGYCEDYSEGQIYWNIRNDNRKFLYNDDNDN